METVMDMLTLTDDEAVVLAVALPDPWRVPLPTVDQKNRDSLTRAAYRGRRSLVVRDLAESDGTLIGAAAEVAKRLGTGLRAFFLLADEKGNWLPSGVTVYLYGPALDAIEVSQTVADAGVHYFRLAPPPGQWQALALLAESIYADGFADPAAQPGKVPPGRRPAVRRPPRRHPLDQGGSRDRQYGARASPCPVSLHPGGHRLAPRLAGWPGCGSMVMISASMTRLMALTPRHRR